MDAHSKDISFVALGHFLEERKLISCGISDLGVWKNERSPESQTLWMNACPVSGPLLSVLLVTLIPRLFLDSYVVINFLSLAIVPLSKFTVIRFVDFHVLYFVEASVCFSASEAVCHTHLSPSQFILPVNLWPTSVPDQDPLFWSGSSSPHTCSLVFP